MTTAVVVGGGPNGLAAAIALAAEGVSVTVLEGDGDSQFKDILVQVKETHTGSLMFGVGVNSDAGVVGSVVLNERNFDIFRPPTSLADILEGRAWRGGYAPRKIANGSSTVRLRYLR